jgi:hypothetical protein
MFGKPLAQYLAFQKVFLVLIAVVGLTRLVLSLAGLPDSATRWLSMTVIAVLGALYAGATAQARGFGGYRQLLPLVFFQVVIINTIAVLGILLAVAGLPNIFAASEYSGPFAHQQSVHLLGHLTLGMVLPSLVLWAVASAAMWITKRFRAAGARLPA